MWLKFYSVKQTSAKWLIAWIILNVVPRAGKKWWQDVLKHQNIHQKISVLYQFYVNLHTFPYYRKTESFHYGFNIIVNRDVVRANPFSRGKHQEKLRCKSGLLIISFLLTLTMQVHFWQRCTLKGGKFTD